jgi:Alr-MurF fusion protein
VTYTIQKIAEILKARPLQLIQPDARIEYLLTDSRQVAAPPFTLFFALAGERLDGHQFIAEAYAVGVRHFVVHKQVDLSALPEANVLLVDNSLRALQRIAATHRAQFQYPVIGITGSNGKTVVKEWLYQLLSAHFNIVRSPKSYNSQIGVPFSVWQMQAQHQLAIFEAGISKPGEMMHLGKIIQPDIGIFTNIGSAHREGFPSKAEKIREKMLLFDETHTLIFCADHEKIAEAAQEWSHAKPGRKTLCWSRNGLEADIQIQHFDVLPDGHSQFQVSVVQGGRAVSTTLNIPFSDAAALENAGHCLALMHYFGLQTGDFQEKFSRLEPVEMRLELKSGINRCTLINDFYNNDLAGLRIALQFAARQARHRPLTLIFSDILQGGEETRLYEKVAQVIMDHGVARVIGIGTAVRRLASFLPNQKSLSFYEDTSAFITNLHKHDFHDEVILLKGARTFAFENIAKRLEQKAHKTVLEVNLTALVHNLNAYRSLLKPATKMMVMVKAAGYGSGSTEIAKLLEFHKADYLGVAYADEGIELRQSGVNLPILVLNPEPASFDALYRYRLEPEVYSLPLLRELIRFTGHERSLAIHLKLDTGMHRLGFESGDMTELLPLLQAYPNLKVQSVFSHLSASDAAVYDDFTHEQARLFGRHYTLIVEALGYKPLRHLVNTGGIVRFPAYHFEMVRLGIGLYGIDGTDFQNKLRVVNTLKATISQIKQVPQGDTVGYNRNGPVQQPSKIATISIGYADGLHRLAGNNRYKVWIGGQLAPTIGNVCMDMTMIDITHIPEVHEGDEVIIFGENPPVQELAKCLQTIAYEVFTSISERVKRVYWQE